MTDTPRCEDDPLAELYGRLPDPRSRSRAARGDGDPGSAPSSRREARERATRADAHATAPAATEGSAPTAPPAAPTPPPTRAATPQAGPAGGLEDLFSGRATTDTLGTTPPRPPRRRRRIGGWIALGVVLLLLGGVAGAGLWVWNTYEGQIRSFMGWEEPKDYEDGIAEGEALVTIQSGDTGAAISQSLFDAGVTKTSDAFYDMLVSTAQNPTFYPGVYRLQQRMTSAAALTALEDPANRVDDTVVIPEGLSYRQALQRVADATGLSYDELLAEADDFTQFGVPADAPSIEGFLFPATYTFDPGVTAHDAIQRMVDEMFSRLDALGVAAADRLRTLSLAAVIQKEAGPDAADMPKIARVFLNRVAQDMPLQSDATVAYGAGTTGTVWTTEEERADASNIYNTYVHLGLPAGPISLPGETAIEAAISPADGTWLYFVAVNLKTGETVFSDTYEEHLVAVEQMRAWCAASEENAPYCQ